MNEQLWRDARTAPDLFMWNSPLDPHRLRQWISERCSVIPESLWEVWVRTGGGDMFETETLLWPMVDASHDDSVDAVNSYLRRHGLADGYVVFHTGLMLSAVRCRDGAIVEFAKKVLTHPQRVFDSLESWYVDGIRSEYSDRYRLLGTIVP